MAEADNGDLMTAFAPEALWAKSKIFIERGLRSHDAGDFDTFHTWAALALELLGKSAIAVVHPALVADPNKFDSLLVACGRHVTDATRSITAKTTYERLKSLSKEFDNRAERFCMLMANRRNEELHSGSSPTSELDPRAWVPEYWRIAEILSKMAERTLDDWVGEAAAARARKVIADTSQILELAIEARISRCAEEFESKYPQGSRDRKEVLEGVNKMYWPIGLPKLVDTRDGFDRCNCPACGARGWLFGDEAWQHRESIEFDQETGAVWQIEGVGYYAEDFACTACSLVLNGRLELDAGGLPEEFQDEREVEPDYEPDYGND